MTDDPLEKPLVGRLDVQSGAKVVIVNKLIGDIRTELKAPISQDDRNRIAMLKRVRADWIDGVLKQSIYKVARIELGLETREDAVESPLSAIVQIADRAPVVFPPSTGIAEVFDTLGQALLILGAPGTGKTTLLLELADELLNRALRDETHPIPAVFNLSTWALKRGQLASWLVSELHQRNGVPKKLAQRWVDGGEILPLLDGLDEVDTAHRSACVDAINEFRSNRGLLPIAVCSRITDFEVLDMKLNLHGAVVVQPLTRGQVRDYLAKCVDLMPLRAALEEDSALTELLETPLMLWVAMLAYREIPVGIVKKGSLDQKRQQLFASFVSAMFKRRAVELRYAKEATLHSLSWLARVLQRRQQTIFFLETLQPNWLSTRKQRWLFKAGTVVACAMVCAICLVLTAPLLAVLIRGLKLRLGELLGVLGSSLRGGVVLGLIVGLIGSLIKPKPVDVIQFRFVDIRSRLRSAIRSVLRGGLVGGLLGVLSMYLLVGVDLMHLLGGVFFGLVLGLIVGLVTLLTTERVESRRSPNQGTRDSVKNAFVVQLLLGLFIGLFSGLFVGVVGIRVFGKALIGLRGGLIEGVQFGMIFGLFGGLFGGGIFAIRHLILRLLLWASGEAPFDYVAFLDYASERLFLRKVGGGYIFTHRMLLEYFASLGQPKKAQGIRSAKTLTS